VIIRPFTIAAEHVGGGHGPIAPCDWGQWRSFARCIACGIDGWIGLTLEEVVEFETTSLSLDARRMQIKRIQIGRSAGGMHDEIRPE
jgi:hypothetical protein